MDVKLQLHTMVRIRNFFRVIREQAQPSSVKDDFTKSVHINFRKLLVSLVKINFSHYHKLC